eukprot:TRINITY_DN9108_c0_g1_i1.p1 TRINITY_DN9108_c0_g1~~TRINITY_DN9108_c0_g1_i1.p1  ORF type:complete len:498 (+),score=150.38 TRINITY_DN9108_c0_g1_i1:56-1495(+)
MGKKANSKKNREEETLIQNLQFRLKAASVASIESPTEDELVATVKNARDALEKLVQYQDANRSEAFIKVDSKVDDEKEAIAGLSEWIKVNAPDSHIGTRFEFAIGLPEGNGVVALEDIPKGRQFMAIPRKLMITTTSACEAQIGKMLVYDQMCLNTPSLFLVMHLIYEARNPDSFWKPYINALPKSPRLPLYFSLEELETLRGSPTFPELLKLVRATLKQYTYLYDRVKTYEELLKLSPPTWREFLWAVTICMARQNRIPSSEAGQMELCLIPGWDMCNYKDGEMATYFDPESQVSGSFTMEDVKQGDQIYIYYGARPNSELFLYSGFVYDNHSSDAVKLSFSLDPENDSLFPMRKLFITKRGLKLEHQILKVKDDDEFGGEVMFYLRTSVMSKEDAQFALKNPEEKIWSSTCERAALESLQSHVLAALKGYKTTAEEDSKKLGDSDANAQLMLRLRLAERKLLTQVLARVDRKLEALG